ncbi:hypothetical protein AB0I16_34585 [Streptomyces sp. NPDC050703]|uniref:hypothetical protein n=1 Tax=Streptomyces sp. NPDC050703 TaxID=3157218 RepID=UPI00344A0026
MAAEEALLGELLVAHIRDAMLGLGNVPDPSSAVTPMRTSPIHSPTSTPAVMPPSPFAVRLPRLIRSGHALSGSRGETQNCRLLAKSYLLATRMLIKMDEQQLGWMAADRTRQLAEAGGDILTVAESARQLAGVLARVAGWHDEALSIALSAADHPDLRDTGRAGAAARGPLIQSATYTVARRGDRDGMRELTDEAAGIAKDLGGGTLLRNHGEGFSPLTVQLHRISAEDYAGAPPGSARRRPFHLAQGAAQRRTPLPRSN